MKRLLRIAALVSCIAAFSAIAQLTTSSGSSVRILSISPTVTKPLYTGDKYRIAVEVEYVMSQDSGALSLVVQRGESGGYLLAYVTEVVFKGKGTLKLEAEIQVPETKAVQIFTPLSHQGGGGTSIVDYRVFKVIKR